MFIYSKKPLTHSGHLLILLALFTLISCGTKTGSPKTEEPSVPPAKEIPAIRYTVHRAFKHDTTSYTQGLLVVDGKLYESTGSPAELKHTRSLVGTLDTTTGKIKVGAELNRDTYFGEGIAVIDNTLYQLTYKNQVGFIYDARTFKPKGQFGFSSKEGWGLTTDSKYLIMSDGTDKISYLDPRDFRVVKTLNVTNKGYAEMYLNELEFVDGRIFANVYGKNYIVAIDTSNGEITGMLDLSALVSKAQSKSRSSEVLNGIAYDKLSGRFFITGKFWPQVYEIEVKL